MAEDLVIDQRNREAKYQTLIKQIEGLLTGETNQVANLGNVAAAIKETFPLLWVGFYLTSGEDELVLGPFQGPIACTRISKGKGVCGTAFEKKQTIMVPDVDLFPGHIACSSKSKSEIVIPLLDAQSNVWGVLDIDSETRNYFNETDVNYLERLCNWLSNQRSAWS